MQQGWPSPGYVWTPSAVFLFLEHAGIPQPCQPIRDNRHAALSKHRPADNLTHSRIPLRALLQPPIQLQQEERVNKAVHTLTDKHHSRPVEFLTLKMNGSLQVMIYLFFCFAIPAAAWYSGGTFLWHLGKN